LAPIDPEALPPYFAQGERKVLGLLLGVGEGISKEALTNDLPFGDLLYVFEQWVQTVAHSKDGYQILIRFLNDWGFDHILTHGLIWLSESWESMPNKKAVIDDGHLLLSVSQLLHRTWHTFGRELQADPVLLRLFSNLVDELAGNGEQIAVELQRRLRTVE
jgi:hypothetical protein